AGAGAILASVLRRNDDAVLRDQLVGRAWVAGLDGYFFLDGKKDWVLAGRVAGSRIEGTAAALEEVQRSSTHYFQRPDAPEVRLDPTATSMAGWTGAVNLNRQGGRFRVNSALWAVSPGFESNDLGFLSRTARWGGHAVVDFRKTDPDRFTRSRWFALAKWNVYNFDGDAQGNGMHAFGEVQLKNYWWVNATLYKQWRGPNKPLPPRRPPAPPGGPRGARGPRAPPPPPPPPRRPHP